jgi:hypothetical protein
VSILLNPDRLALIMKDGQVHKNTSGVAQRRAAA